MNPEYIEQLISRYGSVTSEPLRDLIHNVVEDAVLAEREACVKVCLEQKYGGDWSDCADAIRARGEEDEEDRNE